LLKPEAAKSCKELVRKKNPEQRANSVDNSVNDYLLFGTGALPKVQLSHHVDNKIIIKSKTYDIFFGYLPAAIPSRANTNSSAYPAA
jgi:hypothetical protein